MSDYREECIRRKNVQRGIEEERPVSGRKKVGRKAYLIECFVSGRWGWDWSGRYAALDIAQQAFAQKTRKHPRWGWRLVLAGEVLMTYDPEGEK